jgi:hypothetical protein
VEEKSVPGGDLATYEQLPNLAQEENKTHNREIGRTIQAAGYSVV